MNNLKYVFGCHVGWMDVMEMPFVFQEGRVKNTFLESVMYVCNN